MIVTFRGWVVKRNGVGGGITANGDAVECLSLCFGTGFGSIPFVVEVTNRKELEPRTGVRLNVVNEFKGSCEFSANAAGDLVEHEGGMADGVIPKLTTNLFFGDVGTGHLDDGSPSAFDEAVDDWRFAGAAMTLLLFSRIHFSVLPPISFLSKSV